MGDIAGSLLKLLPLFTMVGMAVGAIDSENEWSPFVEPSSEDPGISFEGNIVGISTGGLGTGTAVTRTRSMHTSSSNKRDIAGCFLSLFPFSLSHKRTLSSLFC